MRYREISKEVSALYFGLAVFCPFEARVPEFETKSTQSAGPVRLFIFCSISIFLLASLVAGRRPQCNSSEE
jgi:hypothetical protein